MWSIDYVVETEEESTLPIDEPQPISMEIASVDRDQSSIDKTDKDDHKLLVQESEEVKSENERDIEPSKREAAIKRVEELVKQMSLSQETEG